MKANVHQIHIMRQAECARRAVAGANAFVHIINMSREPLKTYLREWRKYRELTLETAAERIGMSHSQLSRIERGTSDYTRSTLEALAIVYECRPGDLLAKDPTQQAADIIDIWDHIPVGQKETAARILKTFTDSKS